jgi:uncharacterized protein with ParB-like and HNH nuclease domain/predicted transport protein
MKANEARLLDFLKKSPQFVIPIYQRTYSWTEKECLQLWDDILRSGTSEQITAHFVGSIVYIEQGLSNVTSQSPLLVIDGQQRLTTAMLLLEALARAVGDTEPVDGFSAKKIRSYYLLNQLEEGERGYKLLLTQTDKDTLLSIMTQRAIPKERSLRVSQNFELFTNKIANLKNNLAPLCHGIAKLMIVDISLSRDQDNPQLIFESMNSTGRELTQADLIRNFILMGLEPNHQTRLYQEHWRPMEVEFGQESYDGHFDGFMRHYLTVRTDEIPRISEVYESFKAYTREPDVAQKGIDALVADIHAAASDYCAMALGKEPNKALAAAFADLRELRVDVAYPFLLELYGDYRSGILSREDLLDAVRLIEAYVFRRAICAIPTNSLNKTFATFRRAIKKDRYLDSIKAHLLSLPSYRRFPNDGEFMRELKNRDLYNFRSRSYWLRRLENYDRKERVPVDEYTIEHILPQNENLSQTWREALGQDWKRIQETYLHTLGNLTLTGYNAEYSDRPFKEKRDMEGGFKQSPLRLNQGLGGIETWSEEAILARADRLSKLATRVWKMPSLTEEVYKSFQAPTEQTHTYSREDHPYLLSGVAKELYEALRKEVVALDPCVTEEFLKYYVAYKAETNFVDVIPQAKRLVLMLNMEFHELHDAKGLARDVTNLGRWGNGDIELKLNSIDEIPYIMGLIRQSFEKQMGNGNDGE